MMFMNFWEIAKSLVYMNNYGIHANVFLENALSLPFAKIKYDEKVTPFEYVQSNSQYSSLHFFVVV